MEYGGLVQDCGALGTLGEADMIEELLVEGCWVEASDNSYTVMEESSNHEILIQQDHQESSSTFVAGKRWWIGPRANPGPSSSVKERLVVAVGYLKEYTKNANVVIQIWVPLRRRGLHYHSIAKDHESISVGFGNPNVNVRFFRSQEYPRVQAQQQQYASLGVPVFERGSGACLGVLDILFPNQTFINYRPPLDNLSNALEAVDDFTTSQNFIPPAVKQVFDELYQAAVNEMVEVLTCVCKTHNLPLALTWAPCIQQGKGGCGVSTLTPESCVSTVDSACYVGDVDILGFQEACCEYHLFHGQGIVGTALTTTKPCFAIDITAFSKAEYPLAHHAKMFGLHAALAIPLRSVYTGSAADFVLEFFLPKDCHDSQQQKHLLSSLSMVVQQACRSLHVVMEDDQFSRSQVLEPPPPPPPPQPPSQSQSKDQSSWIAHMMEAQHKGKGVSVSLEYLQEPKEEFKVTTNWDSAAAATTSTSVFSDYGQLEQQSSGRASVKDGEESSYAFGSRRSSSSSGGSRKTGDKRRTKAEKTISLPVLRQYFAGSLKDAAKSIGVCPTTLKRICRQHGITRWPSRKIKKVGHSLKKLQLVIDSVQGAEGAIQIGSFYASFPELSRSDQSSRKMHNTITDNTLYGHGDGVTSSACSQTQTQTSTFATQPSAVINTVSVSNGSGDILMTESPAPDALFGRAHGDADAGLHASIIHDQEDTRTKHFNRNTTKSQTLPPSSGWNSLERGAFRVKATFADEKIRFSLQPIWGFGDLQLEIARRFNLNDISNIVLKYLDDDGEWVVLACDADLEECKDLHTSSQSRTIRLSLFQASPLNLPNTFRISSPS